ncbi:MAG: class I SAM-dependent methyltransferase [Opitutales bacterium]
MENIFEGPAAFENKWIFRQLGNVQGKRVLDLGCGLGESAVYFASKGAIVTASDLSPQMLEFSKALARHYGVEIETALGAAETLELNPAHYDIIYAANVIHHLSDAQSFYNGVVRLLKPDGVFCSWDPVRYNPAINVYRKIASNVRSEDEQPLGFRDLALLREYFGEVRTRFFWLTSLVLFLKYYFWDKKNPNEVRYWKCIYEESAKSLRWWLPFAWLDQCLLRIPGLRWLSWNMGVFARKPRSR